MNLSPTSSLVILLTAVATSCASGDVLEPHPLPPEPEEPELDLLRPPRVVLVKSPGAECAEQPLIETPDVDNERRGEPVVTESFGPDGCIDERWIREWDGARPLHELYDFFDPNLAHYAYLEPTPYSHRWVYDDEGRAVHETRALEPDGVPFEAVVRVFDARGRLIELVRAGAEGEVTQRELWTFSGASEEFETYTLMYDHRVADAERRVFDADGRIVEIYVASNGNAERIWRRSEYVDGRLARLWTWDRYTGAPESAHVYERRSDGTLEREVVRNLRMGWLDVREYDAAERPVLYTQDENDDGRIEFREIWRYDAAGNLVFASTEYDFDAPRTRYSETRSQFDDQGRLVETVSDHVWMQGVPRRTRYAYDDAGGFTETIDLLERDGSVQRVDTVARWHDSERLAWRRSDPDRDGVLSALEVNRWAGSRPLETVWDHDGDGAVDAMQQWLYDRADQLVAFSVDQDADGVAEVQTLYRR